MANLQVETLEERSLLSGSPLASDAERSMTTPTPWAVYNNVSADFLTTQIQQHNLRITDLEVNVESNSPTFTATLVENAGDYAKGWWWYTGVTADQLNSLTAENHARIISLDVYSDSDRQTRFAVVMVDNTGPSGKGWWWYYDITSTALDAAQAKNNARIIDFGSRDFNGTRLFSAVMISNTGTDAEPWWYYYNLTPTDITTRLQNNSARLQSIDARDADHFDVVMAPTTSDHSWFYFGQSDAEALSLAQQNGARIFDETPYSDNGQTLYAVLMLDNTLTQPGTSNLATTDVQNILDTANPSAQVGAYLKEVGGETLVDIHSTQQFEPASMIKVLVLLTAMREVQAGTLHMTDPVIFYYLGGDDLNNLTKGNPDVDPDSYTHGPGDQITEPLGSVLERMMEVSDNRATKAVELLVGRDAINATAKLVGMTGTVFDSTLGSGIPGNYLTLLDAGLLYEKVMDGTLLGAGIFRDEFRRRMTDENTTDTEDVPFSEGVFDGFIAVVQQEAATLLNRSLNDQAVLQLTNTFVANMKNNWKAGSYDLWSGDADHALIDRTAGGYVELPFRTGSTITPRGYVYGIFIKDAVVPVTSMSVAGPALDQINQVFTNGQSELLREQIRAALATWSAPAVAISPPSAANALHGPITYTVSYTDPGFIGSTLTVADITLNKTGTADGTVSVDPGTGITRAVTISNITGIGTLSISLAAGTAHDTTGTLFPAVGPSDTFSVDNSVTATTVFAVGNVGGTVHFLSAETGETLANVRPLDVGASQYTGLVAVALGDFNGDGVQDLVVSAAAPLGTNGLDPSKAGKVFVYDGAALTSGTVSLINTFTPFATHDGPDGTTGAYTNGLNIAVGDVNGDTHVDLVAGTRGGNGTTSGMNEFGRLVVIDGTSPAGSNIVIGGIQKPFGAGYQKGVIVAVGNVDGKGGDEIAVTRGGPVASPNPAVQQIKVKVLHIQGTILTELPLLADGSTALAPFASLSGPANTINRDGRVAFVDSNGDGTDELVISALDPLTNPGNEQVRVGVYSINPGAIVRAATIISKGPDAGTYLAGNAVTDHAITCVTATGAQQSLALLTDSGSSGIVYLDPLTGVARPGGFGLNVLNGGITIAGI